MKYGLIKLFILGIFILVSCKVNSQSILGEWKTIDDISGDPKSILEVYETGGRIYGKVQRILEKGKENAKCIKCEGELKDKPVVGMLIINGLKNKSKNEYSGGEILDPENGKKYRCKIWLNPKNPNELKVRGYIAFFYRTQTWMRVKK
ncbi:MAG: DUF2147 domain-containing protein [Eudoraea sp.]|uniref:DUF2147 domain-containing protein n=1 Tax=Eudoraea sp. TaxID=1979955 RepID=UPI0032638D10